MPVDDPKLPRHKWLEFTDAGLPDSLGRRHFILSWIGDSDWIDGIDCWASSPIDVGAVLFNGVVVHPRSRHFHCDPQPFFDAGAIVALPPWMKTDSE